MHIFNSQDLDQVFSYFDFIAKKKKKKYGTYQLPIEFLWEPNLMHLFNDNIIYYFWGYFDYVFKILEIL